MKTAVEWLWEKIDNTIPYQNSETAKKFNELLEQAMEMEKEQMRSASCPFIGGWEEGEFEDWYNETFKK